MSQIIDTPCIGICSTVYGDDFCRGCKRHSDEVIAWNQYSASQKYDVYIRLNHLIETVLVNYIEITNLELIKHYVNFYKVRLRPEQGSYSLLFSLLYWEYAKIDLSQDYGFIVKSEYAALPLEKLVQVMDEKMYLACAS